VVRGRSMATGFTCIDLFAGCGGLSLGLAQAQFQHIFAIEAHPHAYATYHRNLVVGKAYQRRWPKWLDQCEHDILDVVREKSRELKELRGHVNLVAGGPPCQGFSMNGRRDPDDPRSKMVKAYFDFIDLVRPQIVLLENVQGFASMPHETCGTYPNYAKAKLKSLGYESFEMIVLASDFGVPQRRPRYILIGLKSGTLPGVNPVERLKVGRRQFLKKLGLGMEPTSVSEAIGDLELLKGRLINDPDFGSRGFKALDYSSPQIKSAFVSLMRKGCSEKITDMRLARHSDKVVERFQDILENCKRGQSISAQDRERFGIRKRSVTPLDPAAPAPTITTLPDDLIHYSEPRTMTVREHARIQSFPDWFKFCGPYTTGGHRRKHDCPRYTQVGNAVPPLLARAIGETIVSLLRDQNVRDVADGPQVLQEVATVTREIGDSHERFTISVQN
jgi:DNA (cytosine-5)-methyltransferase 1